MQSNIREHIDIFYDEGLFPCVVKQIEKGFRKEVAGKTEIEVSKKMPFGGFYMRFDRVHQGLGNA